MMIRLVVVENPKRWPFELDGVEVVSARAYVTEPRFGDLKRAAVYNLCTNFAYQSLGYYVSLLAAARNHRPLPSIDTIQALQSAQLARLATSGLGELIEHSLGPLKSDTFELSVYFGRNLAQRYTRLARALYNLFPAPFLRARFTRETNGRDAVKKWRLVSVKLLQATDIPESHRDFIHDEAHRYFSKRSRPAAGRKEYRYDLAILWSPDDDEAPSNDRAIQRMIKAAARQNIDAEVIGPDDQGRIAEYDALFIRETTRVDHHTFRIARRAALEGLVVIDHPAAILRCTNKVYQAEVFLRAGVATPQTLVVYSGNTDEVEGIIGLPCVLKKPDAAFSQGVEKAESSAELKAHLAALLKDSALVIAQAWTPTAFDWRIGVLDRKPLFSARYHMVPGHWQIAEHSEPQHRKYGKVEAVDLSAVPSPVIDIAVKAAGCFGDGLFGVDVKELPEGPVVIEVNDNPNIDGGYEDALAGDELYDRLMAHFKARLDARGLDRRDPA